jgi:hypothetical protein
LQLEAPLPQELEAFLECLDHVSRT